MNFAFVFPGQGSQSLGMLADLAGSYPIVKQVYEEASDSLKSDLWGLVNQGPEEELNRTANTQPIMLAASYACWQVWQQSSNALPIIAAGHSFGEISALTCAQSITFADAVLLARKRGELMQQAVPEGTGAMAAILGLEDQVVEELCDKIKADDKIIEAVNYNAPGQIVVAGHAAAIEDFVAQAKEQGAKRALKLPVSVPAHSSLMRDAANLFGDALNAIEFAMPSFAVVQNATVSCAATTDDIKQGLQAQLYSPVQWVNTITHIKQQSVDRIVELGPGKVLTGLNKRIDKSLKSVGVFDNKSLEAALTIITED